MYKLIRSKLSAFAPRDDSKAKGAAKTAEKTEE